MRTKSFLGLGCWTSLCFSTLLIFVKLYTFSSLKKAEDVMEHHESFSRDKTIYLLLVCSFLNPNCAWLIGVLRHRKVHFKAKRISCRTYAVASGFNKALEENGDLLVRVDHCAYGCSATRTSADVAEESALHQAHGPAWVNRSLTVNVLSHHERIPRKKLTYMTDAFLPVLPFMWM